MFRWLRSLWLNLTHWSEGIEDRGSEGTGGREDAQQALREAQERDRRVQGIKAEVRIVARKYK